MRARGFVVPALAVGLALAAAPASAQTPPTTPPRADPGALSPGELAALLRANVWRVRSPTGGLAAFVASDGLVATTTSVVGDVGAGCRVALESASGTFRDVELLVAEAVGNTAVLRARELAGGRVGLRLATGAPAAGAAVFSLGDAARDAPVIAGTVTAVVGGEVRARFEAAVTPGAPVVDARGHVVGLVERPLPGSGAVTVTPVAALRAVLPTLHREGSTPLCTPPFGGSLGTSWHVGPEFAASIATRGDARTVYPARLTAMFFDRWYMRFALGVAWSDAASGHASMSGGPVVFRTGTDGLVALGARLDVELGPLTTALGPRREYYGLELQAAGYLSRALAISVNLTGGVDRRWALGQDDAGYGASVSLGVGLVARVAGN